MEDENIFLKGAFKEDPKSLLFREGRHKEDQKELWRKINGASEGRPKIPFKEVPKVFS